MFTKERFKEVRMILGLTGRNGSGKGTVAEILKKKGFYYFSLSDAIRHEIRLQGVEVTRERMIEAGRRLREEGGVGVLAEKISQMIDQNQNTIIDSIRNPGEVDVLRKLPNFYLVNVTADQEVRFKRCLERRREKDATTLEEFIRLEEAELNSDNPSAQQLIATEKMADVTLENNGNLEELEKKIEKLLKKL